MSDFEADWVTTLLAALTNEGEERGARLTPPGASLKSLSTMIGLQQLYLLGEGRLEYPLSEGSIEVLSFVDVLVKWRMQSRLEAMKQVEVLEEDVEYQNQLLTSHMKADSIDRQLERALRKSILDKEQESLKAEICDIEQVQRPQLREQIDRINTRIKHIEGQLSDLDADKCSVEGQIQELSSKIAKARVNRDKSQGDLNSIEGDIRKFFSILNQMRAVKESVTSMGVSVDCLEENDVTQTINSLKEALQARRKEIGIQLISCGENKKARRALGSRYESVNASLKVLKSLEDPIASLKSKCFVLEEAERRIEAVLDRIKQIDIELVELQKQVDALNRSLKALEEDPAYLGRRNMLGEKLEDSKEEKKALEREDEKLILRSAKARTRANKKRANRQSIVTDEERKYGIAVVSLSDEDQGRSIEELITLRNKVNEALKDGWKKTRDKIKRRIRDYEMQKRRNEETVALIPHVTLTPMRHGIPQCSVELVYDAETKKYIPCRNGGQYGRNRGGLSTLREWVACIEAADADDAYLHLGYGEGGGAENEWPGELTFGLWEKTPYEMWRLPADLELLPSISQDTTNPVDFIYPVREYGSPFESFGNLRKTQLEMLLHRISSALRESAAIHIPYVTDEGAFETCLDTYILHFSNDSGTCEWLESRDLGRGAAVIPLRPPYPHSRDGEIPLLCADYDGRLWLVDLASQRIDSEPRITREISLFDALEFFSVDSINACKERASLLDCWCVASNDKSELDSLQGLLTSDTAADLVSLLRVANPVWVLENDGPIRLRFFEIVRSRGEKPFGESLSKVERELSARGWTKDVASTVSDASTGHELECVWQTPDVEGFTIVGSQDLLRYILSFGSNVVVEGPVWLRQWHLQLALENTKKLYSSLFDTES